MIVVFVAPPGSGKGTQAQSLRDQYNCNILDTGYLLRAEANKESVLGQKIKSLMTKGELVDDSIVAEIVCNNLNQYNNSVNIIDGFPRTVGQAKIFQDFLNKKNISIDYLIELVVDFDVLKDRLINRLNCYCGRIYNLLSNPPKSANKCDSCGNKLFQRNDDADVNAITKRYDLYKQKTFLVIEMYKKLKAKHIVVDGNNDSSVITDYIVNKLGINIE